MYRTVLGLALAATLIAGDNGRPNGDYEFVPDVSLYVALRHADDSISLGKLDRAGNFHPDPRYLRVRGELSAVPAHRLLNQTGSKGKFYEYRSGRLILGVFDAKGNFVPDIGSKVVPFERYRYSKEAPAIYNLPGYFRKRGSEPGRSVNEETR